MNELSTFIYLADVLGTLSKFLGTTGGIALVIGVILCLVSMNDELINQETLRKAGLIMAPVGFVFCLIAIFVPSSNTMYAIAASEVGGQMLETPTAGKAVKALNAWLDRQIADDRTKPAN